MGIGALSVAADHDRRPDFPAHLRLTVLLPGNRPFVRGYHVAPLATLNDILIGGTVVALARMSRRSSTRD
jgi:hypothetical protein